MNLRDQPDQPDQPGDDRLNPRPPEGSALHAVKSSAASADPLHGVTLEGIVTALHAHYGWEGLAERIAIRCFQSEPSVASSLKFLRRTPWARDKVESLYLFMLRDVKRNSPTVHNFPPPRDKAAGA